MTTPGTQTANQPITTVLINSHKDAILELQASVGGSVTTPRTQAANTLSGGETTITFNTTAHPLPTGLTGHDVYVYVNGLRIKPADITIVSVNSVTVAYSAGADAADDFWMEYRAA